MADTPMEQNPGECEICGATVSERCNDLVCRPCHKSLSFEDCVSGAWNDRLRRSYGIPTDRERERGLQ